MTRQFRRQGASGEPSGAPAPEACPYCGAEVIFLWRCRHCGFRICQQCMQANLKMFTCNNVTWWCADCDESNGY